MRLCPSGSVVYFLVPCLLLSAITTSLVTQFVAIGPKFGCWRGVLCPVNHARRKSFFPALPPITSSTTLLVPCSATLSNSPSNLFFMSIRRNLPPASDNRAGHHSGRALSVTRSLGYRRDRFALLGSTPPSECGVGCSLVISKAMPRARWPTNSTRRSG